MDKDTVFYHKIVNLIKQEATKEFGYCGAMVSNKTVMLNTGEGNITIDIKMD